MISKHQYNGSSPVIFVYRVWLYKLYNKASTQTCTRDQPCRLSHTHGHTRYNKIQYLTNAQDKLSDYCKPENAEKVCFGILKDTQTMTISLVHTVSTLPPQAEPRPWEEVRLLDRRFEDLWVELGDPGVEVGRASLGGTHEEEVRKASDT